MTGETGKSFDIYRALSIENSFDLRKEFEKSESIPCDPYDPRSLEKERQQNDLVNTLIRGEARKAVVHKYTKGR